MRKPRGIRYVSEASLSWRRQKKGDGFVVINRLSKPVSDKEQERVKKLAIPPAWNQVRICSDARGHVQAIGFDAKGRRQYIYHPAWVEYNQQSKFESLHQFGLVLPTLRETVSGHMRQHSLSKERILATIVWLLEHTFIRVGNETYAKENQSYGLTTLHNKHVDVSGNTITFSFKGKSHVYHELDIRHPRVATTIKECIELPGYQLFQYLDDEGKRRKVDAADVNEYLKTITGEAFSAKDFRTWGGTTMAGDKLYKLGKPSQEQPVQKAITEVVKEVASHLGNTATVCRKYYIHPKVIDSYEKASLVPHFDAILHSLKRVPTGLDPKEFAVLSLLEK